jgi:hypothetical protein
LVPILFLASSYRKSRLLQEEELHPDLPMNKFQYLSGEEVLEGDRIVVVTKEGTISNVFLPGTDGSKDYDCWDTGGVLIKFDDGDLQLWPKTDEDLKFIQRKV